MCLAGTCSRQLAGINPSSAKDGTKAGLEGIEEPVWPTYSRDKDEAKAESHAVTCSVSNAGICAHSPKFQYKTAPRLPQYQ